jgi:hypothetical protein
VGIPDFAGRAEGDSDGGGVEGRTRGSGADRGSALLLFLAALEEDSGFFPGGG